jgi:hypothetical protein
MKKLLSILAALALGLSFAACDFGENDADATESYDTAEPGETADPVDTTVEPDVRYQYVRIKDDPENITVNDCTSNPGADIDAIELYRGAGTVDDLTDDHLIATADEVMAIDGENLCPENHKDDENTILGAADGIVDPDAGTYSGYYSLNGREVTVMLSNDEDLTDGDILRVIEMYNPDNPAATVEKYSVLIGFFDADVDDYAWTEIMADIASGEIFLDISFEY